MDRRRQEQLISDLILSLGASLRSRRLYPPAHPSVRAPVEKCFSDISLFFADRKELVLVISDGTLVFEGVPIFNLTSSLEYFMERLGVIGVPAIIFEKGLSTADLEGFIGFLHETKEQGLSADEIQVRLRRQGVARIRVKPSDEDEEDDYALAREIYDNAVSAVVAVLQDVRMGRIPSGAESERVVSDISSMLKRNRDAMLALTLIKNFDEYTYNHSVNVSVLSLALADSRSLAEQDKAEVGVAGLLHDVGKTQLALDLIRKPGALSVEEFEEIKKHPEEGFVLLGKMSHIRPGSAYIVREHHMRFDLQGYPKPAPGYRRHPHSQIIAVADCYDALTTMRSYQKARSPLEALDMMGRLTGKSLDPAVVSLLSNAMGPYPIGTMVRLNSMEVGVVTASGPPGEGPAKIVVIVDRHGNPLPRPEQVDLAESDGKAGAARRAIVGTVNPILYPSISTGAFLANSAAAR